MLVILIISFNILCTVFVDGQLEYYNSFKKAGYWSAAPDYPVDTCCDLMWERITLYDNLPGTFVLASHHLGRDWAFGRNEYWQVAMIKSSQRAVWPNYLGFKWNQFHDGYHYKFPILVNPNNCNVSWYTTKYYGETPEFPNWHFPTLGYSKYGDFARTRGAPGSTYYDSGAINYMDGTSWDWARRTGIELLYVDCKKSIPNMSKSKLINLTADGKLFDKLKNNPIKIVHKIRKLINNSPSPSKTEIEFEIETIDNASMVLKQSFSDVVSTGKHTYAGFDMSGKIGLSTVLPIVDLLVGVKAEFGSSSGFGFEEINTSENSKSGSQEILKSKSECKRFKFNQFIEVPPYSKVTLTAYSMPVRGAVPFSTIYELTPINRITIQQLINSINKYTNGEKMKRVGDKLHMTYDGFINVNSDNEVDVDIETVPLPGHSFENTSSIVQTYSLKGQLII